MDKKSKEDGRKRSAPLFLGLSLFLGEDEVYVLRLKSSRLL